MAHQDFLRELRTTAWRTSGARFNAWRRLKRRDLFGTLSIALFAALSGGLAVVQRIYEFRAGTDLDNYVTALSVLLGFFVIIISLIEWGYGGAQKGEALYRNAERLAEFQRKLGQELLSDKPQDQFTDDLVTRYRSEYEEIKRLCPYNHEPMDDAVFVSGKPEDFAEAASGAKWAWVNFQYQLGSILYFGVFWIVMFGLLWAAPWDGMPRGRTVDVQPAHHGGISN